MIASDTEAAPAPWDEADVDVLRAQLSQAILEVLGSWSERDRGLFTRVHFGGEPAEAAARREAIEPAHARSILAACERDLIARLRPFRTLRYCQG